MSVAAENETPWSTSARGGPVANRIYLLFSVGYVLVIAAVSLHPVAVVSFERDIWHHLSVYRELMASPFDAANPHVATADPSRSYSPWTMLIALVARIFGMDQFGAIWLSAVGSAISITAGTYFFARNYWDSPWGPILLAIVLMFSWVIPINHTGYYTAQTILFSLSYPFAVVFGVGFISWSIALRAVQGRGVVWQNMLILSVLSYFMFVTHQLQGLFAIGGAGAFLIFAGNIPLRTRSLLVAALLIGLLLTRWWYYFDPIAFVLMPEVRSGHDAERFLSYSLASYPRILAILGLALTGVLGFVDWRNSRPKFELIAPTIVLIGGFVWFLATDNWINVRILPFVAVFLQIGLVSFLLTRFTAAPARVAQRSLIILLALLTVAHASYALTRYDRAKSYMEGSDLKDAPDTWAARIVAASRFGESLVPPGSVAISHSATAFPIEATSLSVVAIPRLFAEVPDMLERKADNDLFFSTEATIEERCAILGRYDVLLIAWRDRWLDSAVSEQLGAFGARQHFDDLSFIALSESAIVECGR